MRRVSDSSMSRTSTAGAAQPGTERALRATLHQAPIPEHVLPRRLWRGALVALFVLSAFAGALTQPEFLSDDWTYLYGSQSWNDILRPGTSYHYVPVFLAYLKLLREAVGLHAAWFGAANLALQIANALLLGRLARTLGADEVQSFVVALVYATWAFSNEAVFWITGSATLLMVALYLVTLHGYLWATRSGASPGRLLAPYCAGFLCLYTIESGATVFAVCAIADALQQLERNDGRIDAALARRLLGSALRIGPFALMALSILVVKHQAGGEMAVAADFSPARTYAMMVEYFVHLWLPFGPALHWLYGFDSPLPFWHWLSEHRPLALHASGLVFAWGPSALIAWRGSAIQRFAWAWFVVVTLTLSVATLDVASRYLAIAGAPAALLLVSTLWRGIGGALRSRRNVALRWRVACVVAVFAPIVLGGVVTNLRKGREYRAAAELTDQLLQSKTLRRALRRRGERKLVVLNLPDHAEITNPVAGLAYIFRNGFTHALALRGHIVHPDAVAVARQRGVGYAQNVWPMAPELDPELIEEKIRDGSASFIKYTPRKRDFTRLGPAKPAGSVSLSEAGP